jgi:hypothetical protein
MSIKYTIIFPEYCNFLNFEDLLLFYFVKSSKYDDICFDFSELKWIGVLQASLIYEWVGELKYKKKNITIELPDDIEEKNQAMRFLSRINFFSELIEIGANVQPKVPLLRSSGLSAFKKFLNQSELFSYEEKLSIPDACNKLLGGGNDVDLIRDGDLKEILLHELGENAFIHGQGKTVRYAVSEFPVSNERKDHQYLSDFGGKSYIEVVVSDSGKGLLKSLNDALPADYTPDIIIKDKSIIDKDLKTILYAFEFSSTSNEKSRKERLSKILKESKDVTQAVPTGLFYVAALSRLYGGQIIVRTGNLFVSIDNSISLQPQISLKRKLATIKGTHILVRVPSVVRHK